MAAYVSIGTNRINMRTVIHLNVKLTTLSTAVVMKIGSVLAFTPALSIFIYTCLNLKKKKKHSLLYSFLVLLALVMGYCSYRGTKCYQDTYPHVTVPNTEMSRRQTPK